MAGQDSTERHKALLTVDQQIEHLKSKGVRFALCTEAEAAIYLSKRTYFFKIASYRVLFEKRTGGKHDGQYINLDFRHLITLASLDRDLRYALLPLTLDVKHAARAKLIRIVTQRIDEDGYAIARDYMSSLSHNERRRREGDLKSLEKDAYCGDLIAKYGCQPQDMPIWVLMELFSFGSFASLYLFCAKRWDDTGMEDEHYMLRQAQFVRNACAHSPNLINGFLIKDDTVDTNIAVERAIAKTGLSHRVRTSKMRNPRLKQIATLMYLHTRLVADGSGRQRACRDLKGLGAKIDQTLETLGNNDAVRSSLGFLKALIDSWF